MKLKLDPTQRLYFTSDTHYNHTNICRGVTRWTDAEDVTRDFKTLDQMNDRIVAGINTEVGQDDILFHLGDWSFGGF
jgi:calcineurin-like phosphoesterase family protein